MAVSLFIQKNISLRNYTTFKIGGRAKYFTEVKNLKHLQQVIQWAKEHRLPFFILGNGSNVLFSDAGFQGIVVKIANSILKKINSDVILVGAGLTTGEFLQKCINNNWTGYEWLAGIPGTIGGAIFGNAGAFGNEMEDFIKKVITLEPETFKIKTYLPYQCKFGYRDSIFKRNKEIILKAELKIKKGRKNRRKEIKEKIKEYWQYKINHQLFKYPSAGSIFKNILVKNTPYFKFYDPKKGVIKINKEIVPVKGGKISAGWFIEKCGLKGKKRGGAMISDFHANVIVNVGQAKAKDAIYLINLIKKKVWQKFKIKLEEEIRVVK